MHELGIMYHIVERVTKVMAENNVSEVSKIVLEVGEVSGVVPEYLHKCYPAAIDDTKLENTVLELDIIQAKSLCNNCKRTFATVENKNICPHCQSSDNVLLQGKEFSIREIEAR